MKNNPGIFDLRSILLAAAFVGCALPTTLPAATNPPTAGVIQTKSSVLVGVEVYSIRFPGGTVTDFFKFLRSNGFTNDTVLFAGRAGDVYIPQFTVSNVQLKEVAKSLEFVADGKLLVELVELPAAGDVNVWRIRTVERPLSTQLKTRACAVPFLLSGEKSKDRVRQIVEETRRALHIGSDRLLLHDQTVRPAEGDVTILDSEKVVVAVGTEAYVEAITSALEAAEKVVGLGKPYPLTR